MEYELDMRRLRRDLKDYFGTAMFGASPMAVMELSAVERASDREILEMARKNGFDLNDYLI